MFRRLCAAIWKETLVLVRDVHGLALLFAMPAVFILIMSLALRDAFEAQGGAGIPVLILDYDKTNESAALIKAFSGQPAFKLAVEKSAANETQKSGRQRLLRDKDLRFVLVISKNYAAALNQPNSKALGLHVIVSERVDRRFEMIFLSLVREAYAAQRVGAILAASGTIGAEKLRQVSIDVQGGRSDKSAPTSVQQNVPAWLVFSIFFVAIPFSNTFIAERDSGVQRRLATTHMSAAEQFIGKLIPFYCLNLAQTALMLAVGVWCVPALGGDALAIRGEPIAIFAVASAVSFAALSLALLVACVARTTEQATMASGVGNIILAAIGGVMAPRFLMPELMQQISAMSPMAWGLDAFLELFLNNGAVTDIAEPSLKLVAFAAGCLGLAAVVHKAQV